MISLGNDKTNGLESLDEGMQGGNSKYINFE